MKKKFILLLFIVSIIFSFKNRVFAVKSEFDFSELSSYFGNVSRCNDEKCVNSVEKIFYLKMYDIYYLYLSKYNVKLDLSLLMSSLSFYENQISDVFINNISKYDRKELVENDWNPSNDMELTWDYDYESNENYLVSNDASLDMQVLAKNMVKKTTKQTCVKDDKVISSKDKIDNEDDLECGSGETLVSATPTYTLDLEKYDEFLLEYIEKKYFLGRLSDNPFSISDLGSIYVSDKVPSVISKKRHSSGDNGENSSSSAVDSEVIENLNEIALSQVGNGGSKYQSFTGVYDDWCASFVSWLFNEVDGIDKYIVKSAGAGSIPRCSSKEGSSDGVKNGSCYKEVDLGTWYEDECYDSSTVPQAGDIIVFDPWIGNVTLPWPENGNDRYYSSHIGYVYKVDDEYVYTVEGNTGGGAGSVNAKQYSRKHCGSGVTQGINGYFRPYYPVSEKPAGSTSSSTSTSTSTSSDDDGDKSAVLVNNSGGFKDKIFYYSQNNYYNAYGDDYNTYGTIASHGCGSTSLAIAISSILQEEHDPIEMTEYVCSIGGCTYSGSTEASICQTASDYGSKYGFTAHRSCNVQEVKNKLSEGNSLVVTITNGGFYTDSGIRLSSGGHFFVLTGVKENNDVYIQDPANPANSNSTVDIEALATNSNNGCGGKESFCIITR